MQKMHIEEERERAPAAAGEEGGGVGVSVEPQVAAQVHLVLGVTRTFHRWAGGNVKRGTASLWTFSCTHTSNV
jgi:hypothetical protein